MTETSRLAPLLLLIACSGASPPDDTGSAVPPTATDYCEVTVDLFCPFYTRCGWTAAQSDAECRTSFLETCNAVYEPRWAALAQANQLQLDPAGLAACEAHLQTLECGAQQNELQGPCASIWDGLVAAGGGCGIGLESYVCDDSSVCVLDLSFCGTCVPKAADGDACDTETKCGLESDCVDGTCVARARLGEACDDTVPCYVGAQCEAGVCTDDVRVGVGDDCGAGVDCPYTSSCVGGVCVTDALLGEDCADRACASGVCEGGTCKARRAPDEACSSSTQCNSGVCGDDGTCAGYLSTCVVVSR